MAINFENIKSLSDIGVVSYDDFIEYLLKEAKPIQKKIPCDHISLDEKASNKFISLFNGDNLIKMNDDKTSLIFDGSCPADLIYSETVPLREAKITISDMESKEGWIPKSVNIIILDQKDWVKIDDHKKSIIDTDAVIVGYVVDESPLTEDTIRGLKRLHGFKVRRTTFTTPLVLVSDESGYNLRMSMEVIMTIEDSFTKTILPYEGNLTNRFEELSQITSRYSIHLLTWYGLQIGLLHPELKEVFTKRVGRQQVNNYPSSSKKKRKVKYQKCIRINASDYDEVAMTDKRTINRKCLLWYVIGHYRERNGKKYWVDGFWKGALRTTKMISDINDQRDREVITAI